MKSFIENALVVAWVGVGLHWCVKMNTANEAIDNSNKNITKIIDINESMIRSIESKLGLDEQKKVDLVKKTVESIKKNQEWVENLQKMTTEEMRNFLLNKGLSWQELSFCEDMYKKIDTASTTKEIQELRGDKYAKQAGIGLLLFCIALVMSIFSKTERWDGWPGSV